MITFNDIRITNEYPRLLSIDIIDEDDVLEDITVVSYSDMRSDGTYDIEKAYRYEIDPEHDDIHRYLADLTVEDINEGSEMNLDSFDKALFYVVIRTEDSTTGDAHEYTAIAPDWKILYSAGLPFVSQIAHDGFDKCLNYFGLEEFIILWNAIQIAFSSGDYAQINLLWEKFLRFAGTSAVTNAGCPCSK